jgi:NAD(P)-dependent dehydrogenase (short-subunit alcohol dehydrogenase family)
MGMTRQLALELGPHGVRVNCVAPGIVESGRGRLTLAGLPKGGREALRAAIPLRRFGTVDDVAALIVGLCSDDTSYLTGATIDVNGGSYSA